MGSLFLQCLLKFSIFTHIHTSVFYYPTVSVSISNSPFFQCALPIVTLLPMSCSLSFKFCSLRHSMNHPNVWRLKIFLYFLNVSTRNVFLVVHSYNMSYQLPPYFYKIYNFAFPATLWTILTSLILSFVIFIALSCMFQIFRYRSLYNHQNIRRIKIFLYYTTVSTQLFCFSGSPFMQRVLPIVT